MSVPLTFDLLDDFLLARQNGQHEEITAALWDVEANDIGPLLEYWFQSSQGMFPQSNPLSLLRSTKETATLINTLSSQLSVPACGTSLAPQLLEIALFPNRRNELAEPLWLAFFKRFEFAARGAGFVNQTAAGVAGAFIEMAENVFWHSGASQTALLGYRIEKNGVEYVVADSGIGILASLRQCSEFAHLSDQGAALESVVKGGASRFGRGKGHGNGFRQVLVSLANLYGLLRFRSGDQSLVNSGVDPSSAFAQLNQTVPYKGFLAAVKTFSD